MPNRWDNPRTLFQLDDWKSLWRLYRTYSKEAGWPVELRKQEAFAQMIEIWSAAAWLGDGQVEVAIRQPGAHPMGYAALTTAFSEHPELGHAMEIGTYLAPSARGTGLNQTLKQHAWNAAKHGFRADWLIAAIPVANQRAARAYAKLPFPHLVYTGEKTSPWYQYWRRRQFAAGTPIALYITPLHD